MIGPDTASVVIKAKALKKIMLYAKRYANDSIPQDKWKEVYGFLIGRNVRHVVFVDDAEAMVAGDVTEVHFSEEHYANTYKLMEEISARNDGTFLCGWWHTHPFPKDKDSIFLSDVDIKNHLFFQNVNPLAIALVHDPSKITSAEITYGTKVFRLRRADLTDKDFAEMVNDNTVFSGKDNDYYFEVPFTIPAITPAYFVQSLLDLYDKALAGEPPELAYDEEWRRVETSIPDSDGNEAVEDDIPEEEHEPPEQPVTQSEKSSDQWSPIEPVLVNAGFLSWTLPLAIVTLQIILATFGNNTIYNIFGGIVTIIITIVYNIRVVAPACAKKKWQFLGEDSLDIGQYNVPKTLICGILLETAGLGIAGIPLLVIWYCIGQHSRKSRAP